MPTSVESIDPKSLAGGGPIEKEVPTVVFALNCGSSSVKFGLYRVEGTQAANLLEGEASGIGSGHTRFTTSLEMAERVVHIPDGGAAVKLALQTLQESDLPFPNTVGHRFVHGGPELRAHTLLSAPVEAKLRSAVPFAPLHIPAALAAIDAVKQQMGNIPQAICLDTVFHAGLPDVSRTYPLPKAVRALGVQRYGFHGLSLESVIAQLATVPAKLVVAHLGNGVSITAIRNGLSVDTSMGLTPAGGVMMGTRSGDLDPGVCLFLQRHGFSDADALEDLLNRQSGLLGISGATADVRDLLTKREEDEDADLALRAFCYGVRKAIAAAAAALEGLDLLVFTGGIGEHADTLRDEITRPLAFLLESTGAAVQVLPAKEDEQIALNTAGLLEKS